MNRVINESNDDVVGFLDNDCVPTNDSIVKEAVSFAYNNNSFLGTAQVCNHIHPCTHIYASPAFFFIAKSCYKKMGSPSFLENEKCDVAEGVSYQAENQSIAYRVLYPTHFERSSHEGRWRLSNYGSFGIGTTFSGGVYHLHQGRYGMYNDIFIRRCSEIVTGVFSTNGMLSATAF